MPASSEIGANAFPDPAAGPRRRCLPVGYDGSPAAGDAVRWALRQAAPTDDVVVAAVGGGRPLLGNLRAGRRGARALLEALWLTDAEVLDGEAELVVGRGEPATALAGIADARAADMIVVGRHRGGAHPDVTARLLDVAARPVVVIP